jgi:hypothetical protein
MKPIMKTAGMASALFSGPYQQGEPWFRILVAAGLLA